MAVKFVASLALAISLVACAQSSPTELAPPAQTATPTSVASTPPAAPADQPAGKPEATPFAATTEKPGAPPQASLSAGEKPSATGEKLGASEPSPEPSAPSRPAKPEPQFREVTIPAGTALNVRLVTPLTSNKSVAEDPVSGTTVGPVVVQGVTAVPAGTEILGTVREARRSGRVKGRASIAFRFERLIVRDERYQIQTAQVTRQAAPDRSDDVKKGVIGGAAGAIVGGIVGGGRGAAIGAGAGATGAVLATRGDEVELPAGTTVHTTLQEPLKVVVPITKPAAQR